MAPGDQHEQFYRYSLVRNNLKRGKAPYYSGYQYNLDNSNESFSEGWIFFPFTFVDAVIGAFVGDVTAYNIMALLSYVLCGLFSFLLAFQITKCVFSSLIASVYFSVFPFRTSFLYGEMVYGVEICLVPLCLYFVEQFFEKKQGKYILFFFISLFFLLTANVQGFYFFSLFGGLYFLIGFVTIVYFNKAFINWKKSLLMVVVCSIPVLAYLIWQYILLSKSGLRSGHNYSDVLFYAPTFRNLFQKFSGNEKNIYLGIVSPAVFLGSLLCLKFCGEKRIKLTVYLAMFILSYGFVLGPAIDSYFNVGIFRYIWEMVPGFSSTRTVGRIMSVSFCYFTVVLAVTSSYFFTKISWKNLKWGLTLLAIIVILFDFNYVNPTMAELDRGNRAYAFLEGKNSNIFTVPIQREPDNFMNATFLDYALQYDLKIYGGHSSYFPENYYSVNRLLLGINQGDFTKAHWQWFCNHNYRYLAVHNSKFEPKISKFTLAKFLTNPLLDFVISDKGVFIFHVKDKILPEDENSDNAALLFENLLQLGMDDVEFDKLYYLSSWYDRECYVGQKPFRWMQGTDSSCLYLAGPKGKKRIMQFSYRAPQGDLSIFINGKKINFTAARDSAGWFKVIISLTHLLDSNKYLYIEFSTSNVYKVSSDARDLGCMVSDIIIR